PPTRPVLPPWVTIATPCAAQAATTDATSSVDPGRTTAIAGPDHRPVQSTVYPAASSGSTRTWRAPTTSVSSRTRAAATSGDGSVRSTGRVSHPVRWGPGEHPFDAKLHGADNGADANLIGSAPDHRMRPSRRALGARLL